jgi:CHAT domain-containing protein
MKFILPILMLTAVVCGQSLQKAQAYLDRSNYRHAIPLYEDIREEAQHNHDLNLQVEAQNRLADCYLDLGATYKAMAILKQNVVLLNKATPLNYLLLAKTHQLLAISYDKLYLIEDYLTETNIFYQYYQKSAPDKEIYKALYYAYLGRYYNMRSIIDKAFLYTNCALKIYHKYPNEKEVDPYLFYNAHLFTERNHEHNLAIKLKYIDSLRYFINKRYPYDNLKKARLMVSLAAPYIEPAADLYFSKVNKPLSLKCANTAITYYNTALVMNDKLAGFYHSNAAYLNSLKGLMCFYKKDYKNALKNYDIGIKRLTLSPFEFTYNNAVLSDLLKFKAWCLDEMYNQNKDLKLLYQIEQIMLLEEKYWLQYAASIFKDKQKFNTNGYIDAPFTDLANNYFKLYKATGKSCYIDLYFNYEEKSKYGVLLENLYKERKVQSNKSIDNQLLKTHEAFDDLVLKINNKVLVTDDVKIKFEKYYKAYILDQQKTELFNKEKLISLKEVQHKLKDNEAILNYNVDDYQAHFVPFILVISKFKIKVIEFNNEIDPYKHEKYFNSLLESLNKNSISNYKKLAFGYFQNYFKPAERFLPKKTKHITIIPSISFGNFPFELLINAPSTSNDFSKLPYLVKKYQFSYGLSSSISNIVDKNISKSTTFSVFSPEFSSNRLSPLKTAVTESKALADLYDAELIKEKDASKKVFSNHIKNDRIVSLLSHGSATDDEVESNKGIYLSDGFLSLNEVYNLKAHCDFLILGACESGVGYKSREGNINLARAFTAIGVKSMMLASWKIDEKSSAQIISSFLKYLDSGCSKSEALQKAKLDYLATASPRTANPLYWAGLNITGNNETIPLQHHNYWWWRLGLVLFLGALAGWSYSKKHRTLMKNYERYRLRK